MNEKFTEDRYEQTLIDLFRKEGYEYEYGPGIERDQMEPVNKEELYRNLYSLNAVRVGALLSREYDDVINEAVQKLPVLMKVLWNNAMNSLWTICNMA